MADPSSLPTSSKRPRNAPEDLMKNLVPNVRVQTQFKMRKKFDPDKALRNVRARLSFLDKLQSAADELIKVAGEVM